MNTSSTATRALIPCDPFDNQDIDLFQRGLWPCAWIAPAETLKAPFVVAFLKKFSLENDARFRAHVAADERYELFLDGQRIGRGNERGDEANWFFDSYDFVLQRGEHVLVARVWALGEAAAFAQHSIKPGFLFCPQDEEFQQLLGTGTSPWQAKVLGGYEFVSPLSAWGTGANLKIHGDNYAWDFERGAGENWLPARTSHEASTRARIDLPAAQVLRPAVLPPQLDETRHVGNVRLVGTLPASGELQTCALAVRDADHVAAEGAQWQALLQGSSSLTIVPHTRRRVLIDLENYYCAYPDIVTSGGRGSTLRVHWQEALYESVEAIDGRQSKGNRDEIEGKYFVAVWHEKDGIGDTFLPDGGINRNWSTLWWQCGRYIEVVVDTQNEALTLESFSIRETRYPLENESVFESSDARLQNVIPIMTRALQMCAHETYMDCPFYEQLQYIGDTRLEVLTTYVMTRDDALPRKALDMFDVSRLPEGLTQSRYPSHVRQMVPPFSLWWIAMLHDFALWRGDQEFVREKIKGVRAVLDAFRGYQNSDGLIDAPNGWNFCDWVPQWSKDSGCAPDADKGVSGVLNWHCALVARQAGELERWLGEKEMADRHGRFASEIAGAASTHFWNAERGLFADDLNHRYFSEHAQCLSLLSGFISEDRKTQIARGLCGDDDLARTTIYFSHYLFEALRKIGRIDKFFERMNLWFDLPAQGFKTTFEEADWNTSRSDCHAWGAHPLFHYFATLAGIRPASFGFNQVEIEPQLSDLKWLNATLPHPRGQITAALHCEAGVLNAQIELPEGVEGEIRWNNSVLVRAAKLRPGRQNVTLSQTSPGQSAPS